MSDPVVVAVVVALATAGTLGLIASAALLASLFVREHMARQAAEQRAGLAEATVAQLRERLVAVERVDRNALYRHQLEDLRARELRASDSIYVAVEHLKQAFRTLDTVEKGNKSK